MKKKIICLVLVLVFALSLVSCFKDDRRYDYKDMSEYVTLANYFNREIEIENKYVKQTIDNYRKEFATELYTAKKGDNIYVNLKYTEVEFLDEEEKVPEKKNVITDLTKTNYYIADLGAGSYNEDIEDIIIDMELKITKTVEKIVTLPDDDMFGEYAGEKVYLSCEFTNKKCLDGDVVKATYTGYYTDDNGNIKLNDKNEKDSFDSGKDILFFLGSGLAIEDFENGIMGMLIGESNKKEIKATFPEDYGVESLNGKKVIFEVTVTEIRNVEKYSDKFVKDHLGFDTMKEFEDNLVKTYAENSMNNILLEESTIHKYPRREYREIEDQFDELDTYYKSYYGISFENYVAVYYGMTKDQYIKSSMELELIYYAIAHAQGFVPSEDQLNDAREALIEENKEIYLSNYKNMTEDEARKAAEKYVDQELGTSTVFEEAIYTFVEAHIKDNYTIKMVDKKSE